MPFSIHPYGLGLIVNTMDVQEFKVSDDNRQPSMKKIVVTFTMLQERTFLNPLLG